MTPDEDPVLLGKPVSAAVRDPRFLAHALSMFDGLLDGEGLRGGDFQQDAISQVRGACAALSAAFAAEADAQKEFRDRVFGGPLVVIRTPDGDLAAGELATEYTAQRNTTDVEHAKDTQVALEAAFRAAVGAVRAVGDPMAAYRAQQALAGQVAELSKKAMMLRAEVAASMWATGAWTYKGLGELLGVSSARAHQLVQTGRTGVDYRPGRRKR